MFSGRNSVKIIVRHKTILKALGIVVRIYENCIITLFLC